MEGTQVAFFRRGCVRLLPVAGGAGTGGPPNQLLTQGGHVEARTRPHTPPPLSHPECLAAAETYVIRGESGADA